jgi:hypothetical protein
MKMLALLSPRFFRGAILILFCLMLAGCSTPTSRPSQADTATAGIPELGNPDLLYLRPSPYSRLLVEVDAVEGCVPKESELQNLRDFLSKYCDKPDGIEIVRSDVIPAKAAKGLSSRACAQISQRARPGERLVTGISVRALL